MSTKRGARMTPAQMAAQGIVEGPDGRWRKVTTATPAEHAAVVTQSGATPAPKGRGQWAPYRSKLEWRYYQHLLTQYEPSAIEYEGLRLRLPSIGGNPSIYTPDFALWCGCVVEYVDEVKGGHQWRRGGIDRLRVAAAKYKYLRFRLVEWVDNEWKIQRVEG